MIISLAVILLTVMVSVFLIWLENDRKIRGYCEMELSKDGTYYSVVGFSKESETDIVIPETYNGKPVTRIDYAAFRDCSSLNSVVVPNSITYIGQDVFEHCYSLTKLTLPFVGGWNSRYSGDIFYGHIGMIFGVSSSNSNGEYVPRSLKTVIVNGGEIHWQS